MYNVLIVSMVEWTSPLKLSFSKGLFFATINTTGYPSRSLYVVEFSSENKTFSTKPYIKEFNYFLKKIIFSFQYPKAY
jgi:hypothetical protein